MQTSEEHGGHGPRAAAGVSELRLLVRILAKDAPGIARFLNGRPESMDRLAETCSRTGLSVVLLRALEGSPSYAALGSHRIEQLNVGLRRQEARQRALGQALGHLAGLFEARGQPFILLKGPYLASRFYGNAVGREYVDVDLLVPRADRPAACALLREAGFRRRSGTLLGENLTAFFVHAFDFHSGAVGVDLHWDLSRHPSLHLDEGRVWARRSSFVLDGRPYAVLSIEHEVIFAALSMLRDIERGRPKPKNIIDIIQIAKAGDGALDWDSLLSADDGTAGPLRSVLSLCLDVTDSRDLSPRLAAALDRHGSRIRAGTCVPDTGMRFRPALFGAGNKLWAARAYDTSLIAWFLWWALSLPFRLSVHRKPPAEMIQRLRGVSSA